MKLLRNRYAPVLPPSRRSHRLLSASLLLALATAGVLGACGSTPEVVKQPDPVKVQWNKSGEAEDDPRGSGEDSSASGTEVDLDAPATEPEKEQAQPAAPPPAPEPPAKEPKAEAAPEAAAEPAAESPGATAEEEAPAAEPSAAVPLGKEIRAAVRGKEPKGKQAKKPAAKPKKPAAAEAEPSAAATYSGNDACRAKSFSIPRVAEACARNGRSGAKSVMKEAVGKALAGGASLKCADCHSDLRSYALKKDAVAQLKKWLGS